MTHSKARFGRWGTGLFFFACAANAVAAPPSASPPSAPAPAKPAAPAAAKPAAAPATPAAAPAPAKPPAPASGAPTPAKPPAPAPAPVPPAPAKPAAAPVAKPAPAPAPVAKPAAPPAPAPVAKPAAPLAPVAKPVALSTEDRAALASRVVVLERASKPLALGVVLNGDGRVLTALSALGDVRHLDVRYADGKILPLRLGHADRAHDLALLVPPNSQHKLGLKASRENSPALQTALGSFSAAGAKATPGPNLVPTGPSAFIGNDGRPYPEALAFTAPVAVTSAGSPLVDGAGEVVALITRACQKKAGAACTPVFVGTPVGVVREFLRTAPKTAAVPVASVGLALAAEDTGSARGLRVTGVKGPSASVGLRAGTDARSADVIVALDSVPVSTVEAFDRAVEERAVGDVVDLLVLGGGHYRHVSVAVAASGR